MSAFKGIPTVYRDGALFKRNGDLFKVNIYNKVRRNIYTYGKDDCFT
jgi:hypothetical protein